MIGKDVFEQACDWIVRLDPGTARAADRAEFVRWLNRKPEHAAAYEEMSQLWARMDTLGAVPHAPYATALTPGARPTDHWFYSFRGAVAASLVMIFLIIAAVVTTDPQPGGGGTRYFVTAVGQEHQLVAPDGSRIRLGGKTSIALDYSRGRRMVRLENGDLAIEAVHDPKRPFTVAAGGAVVQALGTAFRVVRDDVLIQVQVTHGSVSFSSSDERVRRVLDQHTPSPTSAVVLTAGQSMTYSVESHTIKIDSIDHGLINE